MRICLLSIFFLLVAIVCANGQDIVLQVSPNPVEKEVYVDLSSVDDPIELSTTIKNISNEPIQIIWEQSFRDQPFEWDTEILDINSHYFSSSGFLQTWEVMPIDLQPGESFDLTYFVTPNGRAGSAVYTINLIDNKGEQLVNSFHLYLTIHHKKAQQRLTAKDIKLYPNPASDYFEITPNHLVDKIYLYNAIGQKVKTFYLNENFRFNIEDFPEGLYLIELVDKKNHKIKTTRLLKRIQRA